MTKRYWAVYDYEKNVLYIVFIATSYILSAVYRAIRETYIHKPKQWPNLASAWKAWKV